MVRAVNAIGPATPSNIPTPVITSSSIIVNIPASKDNTLYEDLTGGLSNGIGRSLFTGVTLEPGIRRAAIQFDLSSIPIGAVIQDASLQLSMTKTISGPEQNSLHKITDDWGEGTSNALAQEGKGAPSTTGDVTWIHNFFSGVFWTSPGGDFVITPSATQSIDNNGFYSWSDVGMITNVQSWVDSPASNFGWLVKSTDELNVPGSKRFDSRENVSGDGPLLTVTYSIP